MGNLLDDVDCDRSGVLDPVGIVGAVDEGPFDKEKAGSRRLQQRDGAVAILDGGRMDPDHQRAAVGIDHSVALNRSSKKLQKLSAGRAAMWSLPWRIAQREG